MNILKNTINIGIEKPFTFLHMTDTHCTFTDDNDSQERKIFADNRKAGLFQYSDVNLEFAENYVKKTGYPLIHTGDFIDFITPENLKVAKKFADETGMLMVMGNHELLYCTNNDFITDECLADYKNNEFTIDMLGDFFNNDLRFFAKEINGVMLVGIDNSNSQIRQSAYEALKEVVAIGKPIILFMHIPLSTPSFNERFGDYLIALPDEILNSFSPAKVTEMKPTPTTVEARDYIISQPLIKAVVAGHMHCIYETPVDTELKQYLTDKNSLCEITVI